MKAMVNDLRSSEEAVKEIEKIKQHKYQKHEHEEKFSKERNEEKRREPGIDEQMRNLRLEMESREKNPG